MLALSSPWFLIIGLSVAISIVFLVGARLTVVRMAGLPQALPSTRAEPWKIPMAPARQLTKTLIILALVALSATGIGIIMLRFVYGIGAVTNLSDGVPWGVWIGFDVMSGVALAAGAFVMAATAHIFNIRRFEPLVRPAILTGLLGYLLVIAGLMVDLGRPYNVWRPLVHWQIHSPLWEVGCCVAIYSTVLIIEFLPVILERVNGIKAVSTRLPTVRLYRILTRFSIIFVIMGVVLSTLHQSSLGSLWVLVPEKLHPLWYSLYLPLFFWISAIAVGLAMTIVESTLSSRVFKRGLEIDLLADLAKAASVVLVIYLTAKVIDLVIRDAWPWLFQPGIEAYAYWLEIGLGVIVPAILFASPTLRRRPGVLFTGALMIVLFGVVLNRLNVSMVGLWSSSGIIYLPSWMEIVVSLTLVTLGVMAFGLAAKYLPVFEHEAPSGE